MNTLLKIHDVIIETIINNSFTCITKIFRKVFTHKVEEYNKIMKTSGFIFFENTILEKYYSSIGMMSLYGEKYPVYCFKGDNELKYPFSDFCLREHLSQKTFLHNKIKYYTRYKYINDVNKTVKRPQMQGYMLDELQFNEKGEVIGVSAWVGNFANNVYSSHVLEYELYRLYRKYSKLDFEHDEEIQQKIISKMKVRNKYHQGKSIEEILSTGHNRASLLGVQLLVVFKDSIDHKYKVILAKRSDDVTVKPGFYQFFPSGGFELYENWEEPSKFEQIENFSIMSAIFRELLEELFGAVEFEYAEDGETLHRIWTHPIIKKIGEMIKNGTANIEFLGSAVEFNYLRNELSFVLLINDEEFSQQYFKSNHESKKIFRCGIDEIFEIVEDKKKLNPASAAMFKMFCNSRTYMQVRGNKKSKNLI